MLDFNRSMGVFQHCCALLVLSALATLAMATEETIFPGQDSAREQAWAEQVRAHLRVGEGVRLPAATGSFLALYTRAAGRGPDQGAVIMLPAPDTHPDSGPVGVLRVALPHYGWHTLAIQLPTLTADAPPGDYALALPAACARLGEAIAWFTGRHLTNLVVLGHGLGAAVAAACVVKLGDKAAVRGLILLGAGGPGPLPAVLDLVLPLEKIAVPILDLYGDQGLPAVREGAAARAAAARRQSGRAYVQVALPGADYRLAGLEEAAAVRLTAWLAHYAPGVEVKGR
jgi:pimeloyl-ACP methyl ester carboxylesterase